MAQHAGNRLQLLREALGITQAEMAAAVRVRRQATVSDWENPKDTDRDHPVPPGALRLAADLCHNDREVFRWLEEGGTMPAILRISSPAPSEPTGRADGDTRFSEGYRAGFDAGFEKGRQLGGPPDPARSNRVQNHQ